jgi:hypothetical protein
MDNDHVLQVLLSRYEDAVAFRVDAEAKAAKLQDENYELKDRMQCPVEQEQIAPASAPVRMDDIIELFRALDQRNGARVIDLVVALTRCHPAEARTVVVCEAPGCRAIREANIPRPTLTELAYCEGDREVARLREWMVTLDNKDLEVALERAKRDEELERAKTEATGDRSRERGPKEPDDGWDERLGSFDKSYKRD